jgi:hypothetical protein
VYVDDIIVKSQKARQLIADLREAFSNLRANQIGLNSEKCVFGVPSWKLLEFIMSEHGMKAKPEKIIIIMNMEQVRNLKGAQRLTGCLAALSRIIWCLDECSMPVYKLLKKSEQFQWTEEAQQALDWLKHFLTIYRY